MFWLFEPMPVQTRSQTQKKKQCCMYTIGRMNPFTSGHLHLLHTMVNFPKEIGQEYTYIIYLTQTKDNDRNPLSIDEKIILIMRILANYTDLQCIDIKPIGYIMDIDHRCFDETVLFVGDDRSSSFQPFDFGCVKHSIQSLPRGSNGLSASKIRDYVKKGQYTAFKKHYTSLGLNDVFVDSLFDTLLRR